MYVPSPCGKRACRRVDACPKHKGEGTMKKLQRRARRFKGFTLGLDLHKRWIWYTVMDRRGNEVSAGKIEAGRKEVLRLTEQWTKQGALQVAFEASGCFVWVFDLLAKELGREQVHVAQAAKI